MSIPKQALAHRFDISSKADFNVQNTTEAAFIDAVYEHTFFLLEPGQTIGFGSLPCYFHCLEQVVVERAGITTLRSVYRVNFCDVPEDIHIVMEGEFDANNYLPGEVGIYWFDAHQSRFPSDHPQWPTILSCFDIFVDDCDLALSKSRLPNTH